MKLFLNKSLPVTLDLMLHVSLTCACVGRIMSEQGNILVLSLDIAASALSEGIQNDIPVSDFRHGLILHHDALILMLQKMSLPMSCS